MACLGLLVLAPVLWRSPRRDACKQLWLDELFVTQLACATFGCLLLHVVHLSSADVHSEALSKIDESGLQREASRILAYIVVIVVIGHQHRKRYFVRCQIHDVLVDLRNIVLGNQFRRPGSVVDVDILGKRTIDEAKPHVVAECAWRRREPESVSESRWTHFADRGIGRCDDCASECCVCLVKKG